MLECCRLRTEGDRERRDCGGIATAGGENIQMSPLLAYGENVRETGRAD